MTLPTIKEFFVKVERILPNSFEMEKHFYPRVLNAQLHPLVSFFLNLSKEKLLMRYCHLNPGVDKDRLKEILDYCPKYIPWAGADLFHVATEKGNRHMVVIETNSCPSGQKSMPLFDEHQEQGGYRKLIENTFKRIMLKKRLPKGCLAVVYDKNYMEASGYAAALADVMNEPVLLAPFYEKDEQPPVRFDENKVMEIYDETGNWVPVRAAVRYVTQRPWSRIPVLSKTLVVNPILACLVGGRNKMVAAKAYDLFNAEIAESGLKIRVPETIRDVHKTEVPLWVKKFGGHAVVKNPYSNAGQGVYTIMNQQELDRFMEEDIPYHQLIVQSLIGNYEWSTNQTQGKFYHVGTMPNRQNNIYAADIRMMVSSSVEGLKPLAIYSRRARVPLVEKLEDSKESWDMLGTNLSVRREDGSWDSDTSRLMLMDRRDFNRLGVGLDDLIEGYLQTILAVQAIDRMAKTLINQNGKFRKKLFRSLNGDETLLKEIMT